MKLNALDYMGISEIDFFNSYNLEQNNKFSTLVYAE